MNKALRVACLALLAGCSQPTELMLIVKAAPGLTFGLGGDVDSLRVSVQPASNDPKVFTFTRSIELCSLTEQGTPGCRPQRYAAPDYDRALTLPVRLLLEPGNLGRDEDVRVWIDALSGSKVQISNGLRFRFSAERRLWLEVPLYHDCIGVTACQPLDQICGIDKQCTDARPTEQAPPDDRVEANDLSGTMASPDAAQACGSLSLQCCAGQTCTGGTQCNANGYCIDPSITCGQEGQPCCASAICSGGLVCASGACVSACGDTGQGCCAGDLCNKGADKCIAGTCTPCGSNGQACCPASPANYCNGATVCNSSTNQCESCGALGEQCCANDVCILGTCQMSSTSGDFGSDFSMPPDAAAPVKDGFMSVGDLLSPDTVWPQGSGSAGGMTCQ